MENNKGEDKVCKVAEKIGDGYMVIWGATRGERSKGMSGREGREGGERGA